MRYLTISAIILCSLNLNAQEQLGSRLENYAGVNSLFLNPAGNLTNPLKWDINLGAGAFFVENNYFFIRQTNTLELLSGIASSDFYNAPDLETQVPNDAFIIDYFDDDKKRFGIVRASVTGPSLAFKIGEKHSVGIFTRAQTMASGQGIPAEFSYYRYERRAFGDDFRLRPFEMALIGWRELGLNYAFKIPTSNGALGFGINARFLSGYEAAYFQYNDRAQFAKVTSNSASVSQMTVDFGFTKSNLDIDNFDLNKNGSGFALDLGITHLIEGDRENYLFRFGFSVLDLGFIEFNRNAVAHVVGTDSTRIVGGNDYEQFVIPDELEAISRLFSQQTLLDPNASENNNSFRLWLPTALSLQADYAFTDNVFLNATLVQRIPLSGIAAERGNLLSFTPRFEHRWFSASAPLIFFNWQDFRMGLAVRLAFLTIGTDNLGSFFGASDFTGTDAYFALKVNFSDLKIGLGGKKYGNKSGRKKVRCYDF